MQYSYLIFFTVAKLIFIYIGRHKNINNDRVDAILQSENL